MTEKEYKEYIYDKAKKVKTKEEAQNFIDKIKDKIETYETLTIKEV